MAIDFFQRPRYNGTNLPLASETAPNTHVGAGGTSEHPAATTSVAGFLSAADKALVDKYNSNSYFWAAYQNTAQLNINNTSVTKINFDTLANASYNGGGNYSTSTSLFTCPLTGLYLIWGGYIISPAVDQKEVRLYAYVNSAANVAINWQHTSGTASIGCYGSAILPLAATDTVGLACLHTFAVNTPDLTAGSTATYFRGLFLRSL